MNKRNIANKENVPFNRPLIKIKPHKFTGSCHLLWCKETSGRSELIRLEREDIYSSDYE
jgi:hypothetical protein